MADEAVGESPSGNPQQMAAEILAQALGGGESPEEQEHEPLATEGENPEQQPSGEGEADSEGEAEAGKQEGDEGEIRTITDLATAIEVDPEFIYALSLPMSDGGEPIPLGEIKDRLQEAQRTESQRTRFEQERSAFQQEREAWTKNVTAAQQQMMQLPQEVQDAQAEMKALGQAWQYLEENKDQYDAGQLALRKQEIQTALGVAQQKFTTAKHNMQMQMSNHHAAVLHENAVKILDAIPEWRDQKAALEGRARIGKVLSEYGFAQQEVDGLYDHRLMVMLRDFAKLKADMENAKKVLSKGPRAPRVLKTGAAPSRSSLNKKALNEKLEAAKKSRSIRQKAAAVSDLLSGSM